MEKKGLFFITLLVKKPMGQIILNFKNKNVNIGIEEIKYLFLYLFILNIIIINL